MREIKFRSWDKLDKKLYYNVGLTLIGVIVYENPDNQPPEIEIINRGRGCFELMQYTGLKDKNGKEIYEGDIAVKDGYKLKIIWKHSGFWCEFDPKAGYSESTALFQFNDEIEVIGNIYENGDLLI